MLAKSIFVSCACLLKVSLYHICLVVITLFKMRITMMRPKMGSRQATLISFFIPVLQHILQPFFSMEVEEAQSNPYRIHFFHIVTPNHSIHKSFFRPTNGMDERTDGLIEFTVICRSFIGRRLEE